tara:strand:+ start:548 stop:832 length:285 start_codon:yes stop_codon:yes gene_type:complete
MSEITAKPKSVKKRERNSIVDEYCDSCEGNITEYKKRNVLRKKLKRDREMTKEYCKEHERSHSDQSCKPLWCSDCGYLIKYEVIVHWDKKKRTW